MPDPNTPLSYIGQSNDPSLKDRAIGTNTALQNLRGGLAQIASQSEYARRLSAQEAKQALGQERLNQKGTLANTALGMNLDINDPNFKTKLEQAREADVALTRGQFAEIMAYLGLWSTGEADSFFKEADPNNPFIRGPLLKVTEAAARAGKQTSMEGESELERRESVEFATHPESLGGTERVTREAREEAGEKLQQPISPAPSSGPQPITDINEKRRVIQRVRRGNLGGRPLPKDAIIRDITKDAAANRYHITVVIAGMTQEFTIKIDPDAE